MWLSTCIRLLVFIDFNFPCFIINILQVLSKDDPPHKTFVYRLDVPVTAQWISLVVAPFEILPDPHVALISHMCLPSNLSKLRNTIKIFHNAFKFVILAI
jgi:transcription initiation factor TFIID subunit 2